MSEMCKRGRHNMDEDPHRCVWCGFHEAEIREEQHHRPEIARLRAALEEIVSGVYATGSNPRDIAKRVLDGATPVQASDPDTDTDT